MSSFNLLLSTNRNYEKDAELEIWFYLFTLGDEDPLVIRSPVDGLLLVKTVLDPFFVINSLRKMMRKHSEFPKFIMKLIPIENVIETDLNHMQNAVKNLLDVRKASTQKGSYCIQIKKRATNISRSEIIDKIAKIVDNSVNLKNPDWIIRFEIIGNTTGISILSEEDVLSINAEKKKKNSSSLGKIKKFIKNLFLS